MKNGKAYVWGLLSRFAPQAIYLVTTMILARLVTPRAFGIIGVLAVVFTVANILLDSGLGGSLIKEKEISKLDCSTISCFNIIVSVIIYAVLFLGSGFIERFFGITELSNVVRWIGLVFPITALGLVPFTLLKRALEFNKIFISTICGVIVASVSAIWVAYEGGDVYALVVYQIISQAVTVIFNFIFSHYSFSLKFSFNCFKKLIPFGFFTSIVTIVDTIYENVMTTLMGKFLNVQTAGYLYQAKRLEETMSSSVAVATGTVAFPILTKLKDDLDSFKNECKRTYNTISLLFFPLLITVSVFSDKIILLVFGKQWMPSSHYLKILMVCGLFILTEQLMLSFVKSLGKVRILAYFTLWKRVIGLSMLFVSLLINPSLLIYTYLITTIIGCCINIYLYAKMIRTSFLSIMWLVFNNVIPSLFLLVLCEIFAQCFGMSFELKALLMVFLLLVYYMVYLSIRGISIQKLIRNLIK